MRLLLAEDEHELSRVLVAALGTQGYAVDPVYDGEQAVAQAREEAYDCIVLDIMMPRKDGITALREIRDGGVRAPVILLTAKSGLDDRVLGLDAGADDYLTKPFAIRELLARLRALTRRQGEYTPGTLRAGSVALNIETQELSCVNAIRLSRKETLLMALFMRNAERMIECGELLRSVWAEGGEADAALCHIYVCYLREKLRSVSADIAIEGEAGGSYALRIGRPA